MRSREDIEEGFKDLKVTAGQEDVTRLMFELLLDIREILITQKDWTYEELLAEARKNEEEKRKEEMRQVMK